MLPVDPFSADIMNWETFKQTLTIIKFFIYLLFTTTIRVLRAVLGHVTGTAAILKRIQNGECYEWSAQVYDVTFRCKLENIAVASSRDFFGLKRSFDHPRSVLADNVSLYAVDEEKACFVVTPGNLDIFHSNQGQFLFQSQYKYATQYITMPLWAFHRLAKEVGDPKLKVVLVSNTGRCGSNTMSQMFERCPSVISMSEPDAVSACDDLRFTMPPNAYREIMRSVLRLLCKPFQHREVNCFVVKPRSSSIIHVPALAEMFPDAVHLFMYRNKVETIRSWDQAFGGIPRVALSKIPFVNLCPQPRVAYGDVSDTDWMEKEARGKDYIHRACLRLCWTIYCYLEFQKSGVKIAGLRFEDLLKSPEVTFTVLLNHCNLPEEYVTEALKALEKSSPPKGGPKKPEGRKMPTVTKELLDKFDAYSRRTGIPLMSDQTPLLNTITVLKEEKSLEQ